VRRLGSKKPWILILNFFKAAQRLSTIAHNIGQTHLAYEAQSIATNLVQTSAAPMLKLSWIEFGRTGYHASNKVLNVAAALDPSDPRVAAFRGALAREKGDHVLAESWFVAAAALEEVRLSFLGLNVREKDGGEFHPDDIFRLLAINNAAATESSQRGNFRRSLRLLDVNFNIYRRTSQESKSTKSPYGLLPEPFEDAQHVPEAPTIETLIVWSTVRAGQANVGLKRYDKAMNQFEWALDFESRKPPTIDQSLVLRVPGMWARLGMVDIELQRGNVQAASHRMESYGHPSIAIPAMMAEADRLRDVLKGLGVRTGG